MPGNPSTSHGVLDTVSTDAASLAARSSEMPILATGQDMQVTQTCSSVILRPARVSPARKSIYHAPASSVRNVCTESRYILSVRGGLVSPTRRILQARDESQQIPAWQLLYRVQHPVRYLSLLQTIPSPDIKQMYLWSTVRGGTTISQV
jgi:hypothetical protein